MYDVFFDTNFLVLLNDNYDIFELVKQKVPNCKFYISTGVIEELKELDYPLVLEIINSKINDKELNVLESDKYVDGWLVKKVKAMPMKLRPNFILCTNDLELKTKLKKTGIKLMALRSNSIDFV